MRRRSISSRFRCQRNLETRAIHCKHPRAIKCARMSSRGRTLCEDEPSWQRRAYERHRSRVKTAKPTVDMKPPEDRPHVSFNAKRLQLERERQARILRDNFILLKKLREIMHRKRRIAEDTQRVQWQESRCVRTR